MAKVVSLWAALVVGLFVHAPDLHADPRKLGLEVLTSSQQRELWTRTGDAAGYVALLHLCGIDVNFERRFVSAVEACVSSAAIAQVVGYYRGRYAFTLAHAAKKPCEDAYFVQHSLAEKLRAMLEGEIESAARYCGIYVKTEMLAGH